MHLYGPSSNSVCFDVEPEGVALTYLIVIIENNQASDTAVLFETRPCSLSAVSAAWRL